MSDGIEPRLTKAGYTSWNFRYRDAAGRTRRIKLGDDRFMGVKEAKLAAAKVRLAVADGKNPAPERRAQRAEAKAAPVTTIAELGESYLANAAKRLRASTLRLNRQKFETHIKERFGKMRVEALTSAHVQAAMDEIGERYPRAANQAGQLAKMMLKFARKRLKLTVAEPSDLDLDYFEEDARERVLADAEMRLLWAGFDDPVSAPAPLAASTACCLMFCAATMQRIGECCSLHDRELDVEQRLWVIPSERTKNKRQHVVPLSRLALDILDKARMLRPGPGFVFPGRIVSGQEEITPVRRSSASTAMRRLAKALGIADCRPHDWRRTATTLCAERLDISEYTLSACLNHISETKRGVTGKIYNRSTHLQQKRGALQSWANLLESIVNGETENAPSNVVSIRA